MDAIQNILTRHSVRKFTDKKVSEDQLTTILKAGMQAPSACNQQPWQFIVIDKPELKERIPEFSPHAAMIKQAPLGIVVCGNMKLETHKGFWQQDCCACVENILLAAHALGLGAVWTALYPREDRYKGMMKLLSLPEHIIPLCLIPIGYPKEENDVKERYDASKVHRNRW